MTVAEISLIIGIIVGILAIIGGVVSFFWSANRMAFFAGQFLAKVDSIGVSFVRFERAFEKHMESAEAGHKSVLKKLENHNDTLIQHEQRIGAVEKVVGQ